MATVFNSQEVKLFPMTSKVKGQGQIHSDLQ